MAQRLGRCLNEGLGEIKVSVKMPSTRGKTERPREPLLQPDIGVWGISLRIGGRLRTGGFGCRGATLEIPPLVFWVSNASPLSGMRTVSGGQFDWGGRLLKCNGGVQRFNQHGRKSCAECKGIKGA